MKKIYKKIFYVLVIFIVLLVILTIIIQFYKHNFVYLCGECYIVSRTQELNLEKCSNEQAYKIKYFINLKKLNVSGNVSDVNFLSELTLLESFTYYNPYYTSPNNWSPIEKCINLKKFYGVGTGLKDLKNFSQLRKLETLNIYDYLDDISDISNLNNLKELSIRGNEIKDISCMSRLAKLEYIYLSDTKVSDISPLKKLNKLKILHLPNNTNIKNLDVLVELENLESLSIDGINLSNIDFLMQMKNLKTLWIDLNVLNENEKEKLYLMGIKIIEVD